MATAISNRKPVPSPTIQSAVPRHVDYRRVHISGKESDLVRPASLTGPAAAQKRPAGQISVPQELRPYVSAPLADRPSIRNVHSGPRQAKASLPSVSPRKSEATGHSRPPVRAKAMFCVDCSSNKVVLAQNISEPLPIASITKLLTAMTVIDEMDLEKVLEVPADIGEVERHKVGIRPGDLFTVRDLLHGMLIESGNDCAEVLARSYPKGGRDGFIVAMNRRAALMGASRTTLFTPSGLDMKMTLGRKEGRNLDARRPNTATAEDVALIAKHAFNNPLIAQISSTKTHTMRTRNAVPRDYRLISNDRLLTKNLPIAGAKTGFTNMAGKCIVALFKDQKTEHMVVVLNTAQHFKAAEKIYRWACRMF